MHGQKRRDGSILSSVAFEVTAPPARDTPATADSLIDGLDEAGSVSNCTRRRNAFGRGLHEAGLCGAHRDRYGRGRLTAMAH